MPIALVDFFSIFYFSFFSLIFVSLRFVSFCLSFHFMPWKTIFLYLFWNVQGNKRETSLQLTEVYIYCNNPNSIQETWCFSRSWFSCSFRMRSQLALNRNFKVPRIAFLTLCLSALLFCYHIIKTIWNLCLCERVSTTNESNEGRKKATPTTTTAQVTDVKWFMFLDGARKIHRRIAHRRNKLNSSFFVVCLCMCVIFLLLHAFIVGIWNMGYFVSLPLHDYSVENVELGIRACMWTRNNWNS